MSASLPHPVAADALLRKLEAEYGPTVLAALLGASMRQDADATTDGELDPHDWLVGFLDVPAFLEAARL